MRCSLLSHFDISLFSLVVHNQIDMEEESLITPSWKHFHNQYTGCVKLYKFLLLFFLFIFSISELVNCSGLM